MKELSIIVPVYNVEQYVRKCIESIFLQGLSDDIFEVIIVNDGSTDRSIEIVSGIISCHSNVQIIDQVNQGLSIARNNGLTHAKGRYVMFVDSDDILIENSLSLLLPNILKDSADMLIADYIKMTNMDIEREIPTNDNIRSDSYVMEGHEAFLHFFDPAECFVWRTIYRRDFLINNHLYFIPNIYFEDVPFTIECYLKVKKVLISSIPLYIYRQHQNSIVSSVNKKKLMDFNIIISHLWNFLNSRSLSKDEYNKLIDSIFVTFSVEMWYMSHDKGMFPYWKDIVCDLKQKVPNLFFCNGIKQRIISHVFKIMPYAYLWFRSYVS